MSILSVIFAADSIIQKSDVPSLPDGSLTSTSISSVLKMVFAISGAIAVLIITIAAFKYVISQGNPQETAKAKDAILYAVIGLVICVLGFTIVTFVIGKI